MKRSKRSLTVLLVAAALLLAYLLGTVSATDSLAVPPRDPVLSVLTSGQWAAVQAANSLLAGGPTYAIHLPLVENGQ